MQLLEKFTLSNDQLISVPLITVCHSFNIIREVLTVQALLRPGGLIYFCVLGGAY